MPSPHSAAYLRVRELVKAAKPIKAKQIIAGPKTRSSLPSIIPTHWPTPKAKPSTPTPEIDGLRFHTFEDSRGHHTYATRTIKCYGMSMTVVCTNCPSNW